MHAWKWISLWSRFIYEIIITNGTMYYNNNDSKCRRGAVYVCALYYDAYEIILFVINAYSSIHTMIYGCTHNLNI